MNLDNAQTECCSCGIKFCVPSHWLRARREDKNTFYCPNGHPLSYNEGEIDKMRRERDRAVQEKARLEDELIAAEKEKQRLLGLDCAITSILANAITENNLERS